MSSKILNKFSLEFQKYHITKIESGASKKIFYRLSRDNKKFIVINFSSDKKEYNNYVKVYNLLKNINISIPQIIERNDKELTLISEDFGNLRFDKIINKQPIKDLLQYAVDTLVIIKNSIKFDNALMLSKYDLNIFKNEIIELPKYYFPFIKLNSNKELEDEFMFIWSECYKVINFDFCNFAHKDFNINNLILRPFEEGHLKCGVIDFQGAFWGENSWDLFSLLEDSRIFFTDEFNENFIKYFYSKTNQRVSLQEFKFKFHFLNSSRQTRLLGRWVKLSKELKQKWYLDFIPITEKRLKKSITFLNNRQLTQFYNKYIFNL